MSLKYGFNIGTDDMKSLLEQYDKQRNGVRSWKQLFGGASQDYATQNSAIMSSYSDIVAQAYKANLAQNDAIMGAGFNTGMTRELIESNRAALHNAYQTYIENYASAVNTNTRNYMDVVNTYNDELNTRAENFSKLYNYAYQYLSEELANAEYQGKNWITEHGLDWLYDTQNPGAVLPWEVLSHDLFTTTGDITTKGRDFFDTMFNAATQGYLSGETGEGTRGFDKWLTDTDAELRDWVASSDYYNFNKVGSNFGTAKSLLGLDSSDTEMPQSHRFALGQFSDELIAEFDELSTELSQFENFKEQFNGNVPDLMIESFNSMAESAMEKVAPMGTALTATLNQLKNYLGAAEYNAFVSQPTIAQKINYLSEQYAQKDFATLYQNLDTIEKYRRELEKAIKDEVSKSSHSGF